MSASKDRKLERQVRPHRTPARAEIEVLMKRCQIGVGGRHALENAHSIMADCYGTLGLLMMCVEFYRERATCGCGDEFTAHDPGTCGACVAGADKTSELERLRTAVQEADTLMGHDDQYTEWRERWAHLWPATPTATPQR